MPFTEAVTCGPQVAYDEGGAGPALCTTTTFEEFTRAFGYEGDAAAGAAWQLPAG